MNEIITPPGKTITTVPETGKEIKENREIWHRNITDLFKEALRFNGENQEYIDKALSDGENYHVCLWGTSEYDPETFAIIRKMASYVVVSNEKRGDDNIPGTRWVLEIPLEDVETQLNNHPVLNTAASLTNKRVVVSIFVSNDGRYPLPPSYSIKGYKQDGGEGKSYTIKITDPNFVNEVINAKLGIRFEREAKSKEAGKGVGIMLGLDQTTGNQ